MPGDYQVQIIDNKLKSRIYGSRRGSAFTPTFFYLAKPGTFHLTPPGFRLAELERDYGAMRDMFLASPPPFEEVIKIVSDLEQ